MEILIFFVFLAGFFYLAEKQKRKINSINALKDAEIETLNSLKKALKDAEKKNGELEKKVLMLEKALEKISK